MSISSNMPRVSLPLAGWDEFRELGALLSNKTIRYAHGIGNAGDTLIHAGARCLFRKFEVRIDNEAARPDFFVWGGGGNLGTFYGKSHSLRQRELQLAASRGIPFLVLPQSVTDPEETLPAGVRVFLREKPSAWKYPAGTLAPDTALAFDDDVSEWASPAPRFEMGIFLRCDREASGEFDQRLSLGDIGGMASSYVDYFRMAALFQTVVTDRLHFAISALILGRAAVLLPNRYYKNRAVHEAWLARLGCGWGAEEMKRRVAAIQYEPDLIRPHCEALLPAQR